MQWTLEIENLRFEILVEICPSLGATAIVEKCNDACQRVPNCLETCWNIIIEVLSDISKDTNECTQCNKICIAWYSSSKPRTRQANPSWNVVFEVIPHPLRYSFFFHENMPCFQWKYLVFEHVYLLKAVHLFPITINPAFNYKRNIHEIFLGLSFSYCELQNNFQKQLPDIDTANLYAHIAL